MFALSWPLVLPIGVVGTKVVWCRECISMVATHWLPFLRAKLWASKRPPFCRYASPEEEARYWKTSLGAQKRLNASNANTTPADVPLVRYYVPKLLPRYRDRLERTQGQDLQDSGISPKVFCKWHHMVFRGPLHTTLREAEKLKKDYTARDHREMRRMARMLTDEEVFASKGPWTPVYRGIWRRYLETKGPDIVISFE
ncbi:hypothetical protein FOMPIDRAFT_1031799 [Fomitopsis schrenkii]|uniref:Uncharacterized protein n=1 Tax=Fomitopsis schrenkii TaxID=2126942 RepID=S8FHE9_FOMSC|nr:hypothetical protein FOMPIDRAFT_1031799 [Fomitopsis schrenkii]